MSLEVIGMVGTRYESETIAAASADAIDVDYLREFAKAHDKAGFDRVLIGYSATSPDGFAVATEVLHHTEQLGVLIAHRPGFVTPTLEARKLATLDHFSGGGRVAIHHISGEATSTSAATGTSSTRMPVTGVPLNSSTYCVGR